MGGGRGDACIGGAAMTKFAVGDYVRFNKHCVGSYYAGVEAGLQGVVLERSMPRRGSDVLVRASNGNARWVDVDVHLDPGDERTFLIEQAAFALGVMP